MPYLRGQVDAAGVEGVALREAFYDESEGAP